ncbi:MAG: right-handed parallel beta-helix repeat-containing protein [Candidatus Aegiribacteria sp.]|nr:right-handed parallel beta-helix repeat-containing protein [Candidatus Aegiribacteria sp.]
MKQMKFVFVIAAVVMVPFVTLHADETQRTGKRADDFLLGIIMDSDFGDIIDIPYDTYITSSTLSLVGLNDVCIRFEPGTQVLLDDIYNNVLELNNCSNVRIQGGFFRHVDPLEEYDCHGGVISIYNCSNITIDNCTLSGCGANGILISGSENTEIRHCLIEDNSFTAFYFISFNDLEIDHCVIRNNGRLFYSSTRHELVNLRMSNNFIHDNNTYFCDYEIPGLRD